MSDAIARIMRARPFAYADVFVHPPIDGAAFESSGHAKADIDSAVAAVCKNESNCTVILDNGDWFTTWSQGSYEHALNEGIVFSISRDMGETWTAPRPIVKSTAQLRRSYGVPFAVPGAGRIYLFYHAGNQAISFDEPAYDTGNIYFVASDDRGETWTEPRKIDLPDRDINIFPGVFNGWLNHPPRILPGGDVLLPISCCQRAGLCRHWWMLIPAEVSVIRCDNILTERDIGSLRFTLLPQGHRGIRADVVANADNAALRRLTDTFDGLPTDSAFNFQEMTIVPLRDGRLLGVGRTFLGSPGCTVSGDQGRTWTPVERLRYAPDGPFIHHPMTMCPISKTSDGRIVLMFTNNDGSQRGAKHVWDGNGRTRNPQWLAVAREIPGETRNAGLIFGEPFVLAEVDDSDETNLKTGISMPQFFEANGRYFVMYNVNKEHIVLDEIPVDTMDRATPILD